MSVLFCMIALQHQQLPRSCAHADLCDSCCSGEGDIYRLPDHMRDAVEAQYRRDVARVHGEGAVGFDDEYKSFMQVSLWQTQFVAGAAQCIVVQHSQRAFDLHV